MSTVTFREETHTYVVDGREVPSVTTILKPLYDFSMVSADVLQAKAELGTAVHIACELDDADDLEEESVHPQLRPYLDAYRLFKQHKCTAVVASELIVHHAGACYAGKLDLLADFDGARWLIDLKTPLRISPAVALQTAAYAGALPAEYRTGAGRAGLPRRAALQLKDDGTYRLHEFKDPNDWPTFVAMTTVHHWKQRNLK